MDGPVFPPWWTERYGQTPPLGHELRAAFPERWFRIHSLPQSKRYPEYEAEQEVLLERHVTVAAEILTRGAPCKVLTASYGTESETVGRRSTLDGFGERVFGCIASFLDEEDEPEYRQWTAFWVAETTWDPAAERSVLLDIAEDQRRALWIDSASGEVYAPYDGGADLILASTERRNRLRQKFSSWLSARPDGL